MPTPAEPPHVTAALFHLTSTRKHFSLADARGCGLTPDDVTRLIVRGRIIRLAKGMYAPRAPTLTPKERHALAANALTARLPDAALSHHSALLAYGLPAFAADLSLIHLTHLHDRSNRRRRGHVIHRADHTTGTESVSIADAIIQTGLTRPLAALVAADAALHDKQVTAENLATAVAAFTHRSGRAAVAALLPSANALAESPLETLTRHALTTLGYTVACQVPCTSEGHEFRIDLTIDDLAIEVDSLEK